MARVLWYLLSPAVALWFVSIVPSSSPAFLMSASPLRSEGLWRGKQPVTQEFTMSIKHRQAPCVSDQSRAKGITCYQ